MNDVGDGFVRALRLIADMDPDFLQTVWVSVLAAFCSTVIAALLAVPFGIFIAHGRFPGRNICMAILRTLMSLPTVLIGLLLYSFLSRRGLFGGMQLLYTRSAMIIGQVILAFPIIAGLTAAAVKVLDARIKPTVLSLGASGIQGFMLLITEARMAVLAAVVAGFGRVFGEVGVSMMLGGNIKGYTRNITTTIALETNRGDFSLGIALGLVLLFVALAVNILLIAITGLTDRREPRA